MDVVYVEPEPAPPPPSTLKRSRAKRTPKAEVDPSQSLSVAHLPEWIRDDLEDFILPTLLDHYGSQEDPWTLDVKQSTPPQKDGNDVQATDGNAALDKPKGLIEVLQYLIDTLVPERPHKFKLSFKDRIVRIVSRHIASLPSY